MKGRETGSAMSHTHAFDCPGTISHTMRCHPGNHPGTLLLIIDTLRRRSQGARSPLVEERLVHLRELRAERRPGIARIRSLGGDPSPATALL